MFGLLDQIQGELWLLVGTKMQQCIEIFKKFKSQLNYIKNNVLSYWTKAPANQAILLPIEQRELIILRAIKAVLDKAIFGMLTNLKASKSGERFRN